MLSRLEIRFIEDQLAFLWYDYLWASTDSHRLGELPLQLLLVIKISVVALHLAAADCLIQLDLWLIWTQVEVHGRGYALPHFVVLDVAYLQPKLSLGLR